MGAEGSTMADKIEGVFGDMRRANRAIRDLRAVGIPADSIALGSGERAPDPAEHESEDTWTTEGAVVGTLAIGTVGAAMTFSGMSLSPQVQILNGLPHAIFTPLLMGFAGWLAGGIVGLGVAKQSQTAIEPGQDVVLVVRAPGRTEEVRALFAFNGALDIRGADPVELAARA